MRACGAILVTLGVVALAGALFFLTGLCFAVAGHWGNIVDLMLTAAFLAPVSALLLIEGRDLWHGIS